MKKLITILVISGFTLMIFAQTPQKLSYQAVIRNSSGTLVTNHSVGIRISILQGSATGTVVYRETYSPVPQTNANGLVTVEIGSGTPSTGTFANINWGAGPYYLKTEADPNGGTSYAITGTSQLLSVPFALFSKTSGVLTLPFSANTTSRDPVLEIKNNFYAGVDNPARVGIKGISAAPYGIGVYGESIEDGGTSKGVYGIAKSSFGIGVFGENTYLSGSACGIKGESHSTTGRAVYGIASSSSGENYGGYFASNSSAGIGVFGVVYASSGETYGGYFKSSSSYGYGVYGESGKFGVYGLANAKTGNTYGGSFSSESPMGIGVWAGAPMIGVMGNANSENGSSCGGDFRSRSSGGIGVIGVNSASSGITYGGWFKSFSSDGYGVYGESDKYGVYGIASSSTGTNYGVFGETSSPDGYAGYFKGRFYGTGSTAGNTDLFYVINTGTGRAVHAVAAGNTAVWGASTSGYAGVDGRNTSGIGVSGHSDTNYGVYGKSNDSYGVFGTGGLTGGRFEGLSIGVYGISTGTSGINYGVYGKTNSSAGYAGYFEGNVKVTGTLSKGGGSFEIDHPLDPANKILRHSFVESPDMMNIYNGNIRTDENGSAEVILPDYFEALNTDFRYQLTVIGEFAQAIISAEIKDNRFTISTDKPNVKVSWQVTGVRMDPWAAQNRIVVEENKRPELQGQYLYPEVYGKDINPSLVQIANK